MTIWHASKRYVFQGDGASPAVVGKVVASRVRAMVLTETESRKGAGRWASSDDAVVGFAVRAEWGCRDGLACKGHQSPTRGCDRVVMRSMISSVGRFVRMTPFEHGEAIERRPLLSSFLIASIPTAVMGLMLFGISVSRTKPAPRWAFGAGYVFLAALWCYTFVAGYRTLMKSVSASSADARRSAKPDVDAVEHDQDSVDLCGGGWGDFPNRGEWWTIGAVFVLFRAVFAFGTITQASGMRLGVGVLWGSAYAALFVAMSWWRAAQLARRMAKWRDTGMNRALRVRVWNGPARRMNLDRGPAGWMLTDGTHVVTLSGSPPNVSRWQRWGATKVRVGDHLLISPYARIDLAAMLTVPRPRRLGGHRTATEQLCALLAPGD